MTADADHRLVVLHGFTQTHHHVHALGLRLARRCRFPTLVTPDLPGHGLSAHDPTPLDETATRLTRSCGRGTYLGYSMGGRYALAAAVARPTDVHRLVLIGATAGPSDTAAATDRRRDDARRADRLEQVGVEQFLDEWLAMPLFDGVPDSADDVAHRRRNTASGLASSLRHAGTGTMAPLWNRLGEITAPTLVVTGERDDKFTAIARQLCAGIPHADQAVVPQAGHAAHLEHPDATFDLVADWIDRTRI